MLKYYIDSPPGKCSGPTDHTLRTAGSRTLAPSFIHVFQPHVPVTISASTVSQVRAIVITCVATFLVLYTFSSIFHLTPTPASSNVEHHPPTDTLAPLPPVEQASSKPEDSKPGDEVEYGSEEFPISEDVIPHGVSVIMPDNFVKHLVVPHMSSEDVTWFTYLSEDLNIIAKPYFH